MHSIPFGRSRSIATLGLIGVVAIPFLLSACGGDDGPAPVSVAPTVVPLSNQLYAESNETANAVIHLTRQTDGTLLRKESTLTGGAGTNAVGANGATAPDSLASQHALVASTDGSLVFAVNGGDDSISVLAVNQTTGVLSLLKRTPSAAGHIPNSLAFSKGILYATFIAGTNQLAAYKVQADGSLTQIGAYNLTTASSLPTISPTQVIASPDGAFIVVSAGTASNAVISYPVNTDGTLGIPLTNSRQLTTPFAAAFLPGSVSPVYLSTSIASVSLTAFTFSGVGALTQVGQASASTGTGVAAPCWLSVTPNGTYAYVGNGSGVISAYSIGSGASLTLLAAVAAQEPSALTGVNSVAADSYVSPDGKYFYTAYLGDDKIVAYSIGGNGSLTKLGETVIGTATKLSLQGLAGI